jgi:hypothetical protein
MTHTAKPDLDKPAREKCDDERIFASPVARAVVRTVMARRGVTEVQARRIYLDYINRTEPARERRPCPAA